MGDQIRQADGSTGTVWLKWEVHKTQEMYNLTVDTAHTFYVGEGQWLVHNACPVNKKGIPYPNVDIPGYGKVPFPDGPYTPNNTLTRAKEFTKQVKDDFKVWWKEKYDYWPSGDVQIHHIKPLKWGGTNVFENLVPLKTKVHKRFTSWWASFK